MTWTVRLSTRAQYDLATLPEKHSDAVINYIFERLPQNPQRMSKPLHGELEGARSARIGKVIRVVFELTDRTIDVLAVDYRSRIYSR